MDAHQQVTANRGTGTSHESVGSIDGLIVDDIDTDHGIPQPQRRPEAWPATTSPGKTRSGRAQLLANEQVNLDSDAAGALFEGAVDTVKLRALVERHRVGDGMLSLLSNTPIARGSLFCTAPHERFSDLGILPDVLNRRFGHTVATGFAGVVNPLNLTFGTFGMLTPDNGAVDTPLAILHLRLPDRAALRTAVIESFRRTATVDGGKNLYTDSILTDGVRDPLLLFLVRVSYDDGTEETYLMSGDGNSRLVSLWLARTGGSLDEAASAMANAVIGDVGKRQTAAMRSSMRSEVDARSALVERGLLAEQLTESTIRTAQTQVLRAVVVVGAVDHAGRPLTDLAAAKDDVVSSVHVNTTPWAAEAQNTHGMVDVIRRAGDEGLIAEPAALAVMLGLGSAEQMHDDLGLPPHPLWGSALMQQVLLNRNNAAAVKRLVRAKFGDKQLSRMKLGERIGSTVLAPYRTSALDMDRATNAFSNGGTITDLVWNTDWQLTLGGTPREALDAALAAALAGDRTKKAELTVLGGTAAIMDGLLTRDRGSKLVDSTHAVRTAGKVPFRSTTTRVLERLAQTEGGLRVLHSLAVTHAEGGRGLPKLFHTRTADIDGEEVVDGNPVLDKAGVQKDLELEWDLFAAADPAATAAVLSSPRPGDGSGHGVGDDLAARQRDKLGSSITAALRAADQLQQLAKRLGTLSVFGDYDSVLALTDRVTQLEKILIRHEPQRPILALLDDEDDGESEPR